MFYIPAISICIVINVIMFLIFSNNPRLFSDFSFLTKIQDINIFSFDLFYSHVPLASITVLLFFLIFAITIRYFLGWRNPAGIIWRQACLLVNIVFCVAAIISGELWSISTWGTLAPLDARYIALLLILITNFLVFFSVHVSFRENRRSGFSLSNFLLLFSLFNYPIVKYSVLWWNSIHMANLITWSADNNQIFFAMDALGWNIVLFLLFAYICVLQTFFLLESYYCGSNFWEYAEIR